MVLKAVAAIFGIIMIAVGILGFVPEAHVNGELFGMFMVDPLHNIIHLITGIIALLTAMREDYARIYFKIFGIIYAIVAIAGFLMKGDLVVMQVNQADNFLHVVIAIIALYFGFLFRRVA